MNILPSPSMGVWGMVWECGVGVLEYGSESVEEEGVVGLTPDRYAIMKI